MELQDIALQLRHRDAPARCDDECRDARLQASWDLTGRVAGLAHATLAAKVATVRHVLPAVRAARRQRWRMSCRQLRVGDDMVATARAGVVADVGAIRCCLQKQVELRADLLQLDFGGPARLLCLVAHSALHLNGVGDSSHALQRARCAPMLVVWRSWRVHQRRTVALRPSQRSVSPPVAAVATYALRTCSSIGLS